MADAFARATDLTEPGAVPYNVGTGEARSMQDVLDVLVGLARVPVRTDVDPSRVRSGASSVLSLDTSRFRAATGWQPRIALERSLADLLDYWRAFVRVGVTK